LLQRFPYVAPWRLEYGEFQLKQGNLSIASDEFRTALRLDASLAPMAYVGLASVAMKQRLPAEAERLLREAVNLGLHPIIVHGALATLLDRLGRVDEASEELK